MTPNEGGYVDALSSLRDCPGGRNGRCPRMHAFDWRAPAPYQPLRAGWAFAPGQSGGDEREQPRAPMRAQSTRRTIPMTATPKSDKDRVVIFDTTLRDGEQSPGAPMTHEEKLEVAELLDQMGVDVIEAGFPIASEGDFHAVHEIAERTRNAVVAGLARAGMKDIDRCAEAIK